MSGADVVTGSDIIGALLRGYEPLTSFVPVSQIKAGRLGTAPLPALVITMISSVDRQTLKRGRMVRRTDRISVTVRAESHRDRKFAIRLIRLACADRTGRIAGAERVSVLTAGKGPEVDGPADSFEQAQDFKVSFDEPAF